MYNEKVIMSEEKKIFLFSVDLLNPKTLLIKLNVFLNITLYFFFLNCSFASLFIYFIVKTTFFSMFSSDWWYLLVTMKTKVSVKCSAADILLHR